MEIEKKRGRGSATVKRAEALVLSINGPEVALSGPGTASGERRESRCFEFHPPSPQRGRSS